MASSRHGLPYAIAAAVAYPGRQVVAVVGDGGLTMLMGELATIAKYALPIKIMVIKNNSFGEIKWEQLVMEDNPTFGVDLQPIDFAAVARACGVPGYGFDRPSEAEDVVRVPLGAAGPRSSRPRSIPTSRPCRARLRPSRRSAS
jgi:pyruvate dehydrogenase (quinone)